MKTVRYVVCTQFPGGWNDAYAEFLTRKEAIRYMRSVPEAYPVLLDTKTLRRWKLKERKL